MCSDEYKCGQASQEKAQALPYSNLLLSNLLRYFSRVPIPMDVHYFIQVTVRVIAVKSIALS
jgi:hypothetical protein